jgi:hypothetical protein
MLGLGLTCEYIRERKKRGKPPQKYVAQQQAAAVAAVNSAPKFEDSDTPQSSDEATASIPGGSPKLPEGQRPLPELPGRLASMVTIRPKMEAAPVYHGRTLSMSPIDSMPEADIHYQMSECMQYMQPPRIQTQGLPMDSSIPEYTTIEDYHWNVVYQSPHQMLQPEIHTIIPCHGHGIQYSDSPYKMMSPQIAHTQAQPSTFRLDEGPSTIGYMTLLPGGSEWMLPSPSTTM